jgi:hypothetical protein
MKPARVTELEQELEAQAHRKTCVCAGCCQRRTGKQSYESRSKRKPETKRIVVKKYKGEKELEKGLTLMATLGYVTQNQASRKAMYSAAAGILTRKQIHTVTFVKEAS